MRNEIIMTERPSVGTKTIVLVHGGFVDGSGWEGVYNILRKDGYTVAIVQNPTISLANDVAATKRIIVSQKDPVILVGHSYGGAVITEAGNDPRVALDSASIFSIVTGRFRPTRSSKLPGPSPHR